MTQKDHQNTFLGEKNLTRMTEDKRWGDMKGENIIFTLEGAEEYSEELYLILTEKNRRYHI